MGLTLRGVRHALTLIDRDGKCPTELAPEVLSFLVDQQPKAFRDPAINRDEIDWDAVLEWIARILELLIRLFLQRPATQS